MESLSLKIFAVDLLEKTEGKYTPGVDGKAFRKTIKLVTNKKENKELIEDLKTKHLAHGLASLWKGSNQQVLGRRDGPLTPSERLRTAMAGNKTGVTVGKLAMKE